MKRFLIAVLLFLLTGLSMGADSIRAPKGFAGKLYAGTLALYGTQGPITHFVCTAFPYEKIPGGYRVMSAGHCVQGIPPGIDFSVAEQIGGPALPVTMVKAYLGDGTDFSIFELKTTKQYPVFNLGTEKGMRIGDRVINPNFALGLGKQLSRGVVSSGTLTATRECDSNCAGGFMVQMYGAQGSSGSPVLSEKTHKVVGICVYGFEGTVGFTVEPISKFAAFLAGPNQPHPTLHQFQIIIHEEDPDDK
jgi:hypothetical protein